METPKREAGRGRVPGRDKGTEGLGAEARARGCGGPETGRGDSEGKSEMGTEGVGGQWRRGNRDSEDARQGGDNLTQKEGDKDLGDRESEGGAARTQG